MSTPTETIKKAIDESLGPLIADHRTYLADVNGPLLPVSRSDLHYVFDQYGTQLLDFSNWMLPVGHTHPQVVNTIKEHLGYYLRTAEVGRHVLRWPVEYAARIVASFADEPDHLPKLRVQFTEGQREALHLAVNVAMHRTGRRRIGIVDTGVHDWYSRQNHVDMRLLPIDEFWLNDFRWADVGALVLSLVTADGRVLDGHWVQQVANEAKGNGVPLIIDESLTGFGRTGTMWAQHNVNVDADITVLGGPLGGGFALGAVVASPEVFASSGADWDVSPQAGNPVACAAGAATLIAINFGVIEHVKEAAGTFDDGLQGLIGQFPEYVVATHGIGLWRVLEFQTDTLARTFEVDARDHGLLVAPPVGSSVILTPPLICSEMEISRGVDLIADTLLAWYEADNV